MAAGISLMWAGATQAPPVATLTPSESTPEQLAIAAAQAAGAYLGYIGTSVAGVFEDSAGTTLAGLGSPVGRLSDRAGTQHAVQATAGLKPTLVQVGSVYALQYDGADDALLLPAAYTGGDTTLVVAVAAQAAGASGWKNLLGATGAGSGIGVGTFGSKYIFAARAYSLLATDYAPGGFVMEMVVNAATQTAKGYINGALVTTFATGGVLSTNLPDSVGTSNGLACVGKIALAAKAPVAMTDTERRKLGAFAASLIGVPYV